MISTVDIAPFAGTVGGGFILGLITGYAIKKVIKLAAVIVGLFIAALAYLEYQRIVSVDWNRIQVVSQNGVTWVADAIVHISNTIGAPHSGVLSHVGIPQASSASARIGEGLGSTMLLLEKLFGARSNGFFDEIIGHKETLSNGDKIG